MAAHRRNLQLKALTHVEGVVRCPPCVAVSALCILKGQATWHASTQAQVHKRHTLDCNGLTLHAGAQGRTSMHIVKGMSTASVLHS